VFQRYPTRTGTVSLSRSLASPIDRRGRDNGDPSLRDIWQRSKEWQISDMPAKILFPTFYPHGLAISPAIPAFLPVARLADARQMEILCVRILRVLYC